MSWQLHRRLHGIPEMGQFPLVDPKAKAPDASISSYARDAVQRIGKASHGHPRRIYECPKTGRTFAFWDNYRIHAAAMARLPEQLQLRDRKAKNDKARPEDGAAETGRYLSPADGVVFCRKGHLRAHQAGEEVALIYTCIECLFVVIKRYSTSSG